MPRSTPDHVIIVASPLWDGRPLGRLRRLQELSPAVAGREGGRARQVVGIRSSGACRRRWLRHWTGNSIDLENLGPILGPFFEPTVSLFEQFTHMAFSIWFSGKNWGQFSGLNLGNFLGKIWGQQMVYRIPLKWQFNRLFVGLSFCPRTGPSIGLSVKLKRSYSIYNMVK